MQRLENVLRIIVFKNRDEIKAESRVEVDYSCPRSITVMLAQTIETSRPRKHSLSVALCRVGRVGLSER